MAPTELTSIQVDRSAAAARGRKRPLVSGVVASFCVHLSAVVALIVVPYLVWLWTLANSMPKEPQITIVAAVAEEKPEQPPAPVVEVNAEASPPTEVLVDKLVDKKIDEANQRPEEENLDEFAKQARRLEKISDADSVDAMADKFHQWLGTKKRASQPAEEPVAGKFDFDSAQIHEVKREQGEDGTWEYICVLVDAEGRSMETELDEIEGEKQYRTFQRLKQFPLAEKVYRDIAMPLLDKMLQERK
jgi:hypothetical protein